MKQLILFFSVLCISFTTIKAQHISSGKYRKIFYLPELSCTRACYLTAQRDEFIYILMGEKDGDDFEIRVCKNETLVMFQRFFMNGSRSDENFRTWFRGTVKLKPFLEDIFGITWKGRTPYIE